ncbi:MAG: hypothetical protein ACKOUR_00045 [Planctomycetota bacterium]
MNAGFQLASDGPLLVVANWGSVHDYFLWGSLFTLLITPVILSRTRWGESRVLTICVTLSLLAHTLFMVYAYATRVPFASFPIPNSASGDGPIISLNLLGEDWEPAGGDPDLGPSATQPSNIESVPTERPLPTDRSPSPTLPNHLIAAVENESPPPRSPTETARPSEPVPELIPTEAPSPMTVVSERPTESVAEKPSEEERDVAAPAAPALDEPRAEVVRAEVARAEEPAAEKTRADVATTEGPRVAPAASDPVEPPVTRQPIDPTVPLRRADQEPVPQLYRNRMEPSHLGMALRDGGNQKTEAAVNSALGWLIRNQSTDGRWDPARFGAGQENRALGHDRGGAGAHADTGITALALLALLGSGHTHLQGEHREAVQHGLEFLMRQQRTDGELGGSAELFARMYCHSMSTLALGEAYSMTGDTRLRPFVERAVRYTLAAQDPQTGGWRYRPGDTGDMSQFGWQVMSLKSAQLSRLEIPERSRLGMVRFIDQCSSGTQRGLASYRPGERPSRTMTAESLVCRLFVGVYRDEQLREAERFLLEELPQADKENFYYWYYGTLAMFQVQGDGWLKWNQALQQQLLTRQRSDGEWAGSWNPDPIWGSYGGRVFSTALGALCLEVYYRYLPLYQTARTAPATTTRR